VAIVDLGIGESLHFVYMQRSMKWALLKHLTVKLKAVK
jgi:hypothetical protein